MVRHDEKAWSFVKNQLFQMSMNQDGLASLSGGGPICTVVMSSTHDQVSKAIKLL
jgi:hypothetical protein